MSRGGRPGPPQRPPAPSTHSYYADGTLRSAAHGTPAPVTRAAANASYTYTPGGQVGTMTDGTGSTTYSYDDLGDMQSVVFAAAPGSGLASGTTSYTYTSTGQRATLYLPRGTLEGLGHRVYVYNDYGQLGSVYDWADNITGLGYDADGNNTTVTYPNGTYVGAYYDLGGAEGCLDAATGTPTGTVTCPAQGTLAVNYSINGAEQAAGEADTGAISASKSYSYDAATAWAP